MKPSKVIFHYSASPDSQDIGVEEIDRQHRAKGWSQVGYHYVVRRSGEIEKGRRENVQGAHTKGHNVNTLGICIVGMTPTREQIKSVLYLSMRVLQKYQINWTQWYGHKELANTLCPGFQPDQLRLLIHLFEQGLFSLDEHDFIDCFLDCIALKIPSL